MCADKHIHAPAVGTPAPRNDGISVEVVPTLQEMAAAPKNRVRIGGYLTPEAADGWEQYCARTGCNVTALLEAIGLALREEGGGSRPLEAHVEEARQIEAARARRRRKKTS